VPTSFRVLAFAGSTRQASFNKTLVRAVAETVKEAGAQITMADLADYRLPVFDADDEAKSGKPAAALAFKRLMMDHDAFLIGSPEYNGSLTGVLKNTIDWVSRPDDDDEGQLPAFRNKVVALVSASPGALGGLRGLVHVRAILAGLGCLVLPDQVAVPKAHEAFTQAGEAIAVKDEALGGRVAALGQRLVDVGTRLRPSEP
jgi:chromate reductase